MDNDNTTIVEFTTIVRNVHDFVEMPGIGRVYRGNISITQLARLIRKGTLKYAPGYQRGFRKVREDPTDYEPLQQLTDEALQIKTKRAEEMAVKYLQGALFSASIIWNARKEEGEPEPKWDAKSHDLALFTVITVPDTAHRHRAYYVLDRWKKDPESVPASVIVNEKPVQRSTILELLDSFEPSRSWVFLEIYNLTPLEEGHLYDQFNFDAKRPDRAVGIQLNRTKTPSRRFVDALMKRSRIFAEAEIETRANTIASDSRKLTTISTLVAAAEEDSFKKLLLQLEEGPGATYNDFVDFVNLFFSEYGKVFTQFQPGTSAPDRHALRKDSFALSNVMFHPLFRLARDLWEVYRERRQDWRGQREWKDAIGKMDRQVSLSDGNRVRFMSRDNPEWIGKVLIADYGPEGLKGYILNNTRQTREAAYKHLLEAAGLGDFVKKAAKAA